MECIWLVLHSLWSMCASPYTYRIHVTAHFTTSIYRMHVCSPQHLQTPSDSPYTPTRFHPPYIYTSIPCIYRLPGTVLTPTRFHAVPWHHLTWTVVCGEHLDQGVKTSEDVPDDSLEEGQRRHVPASQAEAATPLGTVAPGTPGTMSSCLSPTPPHLSLPLLVQLLPVPPAAGRERSLSLSLRSL